MTITLTELARKAGVSIATVSRALTNSDHPMNEDTRQRILELAREAGYQPNQVARSLRTSTTKTVGILVENISSPFIAPIIRGIQDTLKPAGYLGLIINTDWDEQVEMESLHILNNRQIDGIIFVATWHRDTSLLEKMTRKPYVFVHRHFNSYSSNSVLADDRDGARKAVGHLADLGHRRIAYLSGPADWDASHFRLQGYREELAARRLPYDEQLVIVGSWEVEGGYQSVRQLLDLAEPPTAVFAGNDMIALGAIQGAQDRGLHVPRDLAVVGYDDREFSSFVRPSISTVSLPCHEMGAASAKSLLTMMAGEIQNSEPIAVSGQLIVRESCGARPVR
jgi:DNA-binding LacI/PurR family transcriptional regulator